MDFKINKGILVLALGMSPLRVEGVEGSHNEPVHASDVTTSSRILSSEQKPGWLDAMSSKLAMAKRSVGPFGMAQDPDAKPVKPKEKTVQKGAFLEAVAAIKINTVMPMEKKFTSSSREFSVGDIFPVIKNQRQFNVEVMEIKTSGIVFKNIDSGEQVRKNLNTLPVGMKKSAQLNAVPGVFPANRRNAMPLVLDEDKPLRVTRQ